MAFRAAITKLTYHKLSYGGINIPYTVHPVVPTGLEDYYCRIIIVSVLKMLFEGPMLNEYHIGKHVEV